MTRVDQHDGELEIEPVSGGDVARRARELIAQAEAGSPHGELVDEQERQRLDQLIDAADGEAPASVDGAWHPFLAELADRAAGYASILEDDGGGGATVELIVASHHRRKGIGHALLDRLEATARDLDVERLRIWSRDADVANRRFAESRGYRLNRQLDILARGDVPVPRPDVPEGVTVRTHEPGQDDDEVIRVLNTAFPDNRRRWTQERLDRHRDLDWFDPDGLLVGAADAQLLGLHWTKQRGGGVGEVHILAIAPEGQGSGLGRALLRAGLRHLYATGNDEVILWMDATNAPARHLYVSEGFVRRYTDSQYARTLP